ncbi:hypothetical protein [Enterococcus sp. DIV0187]
MIWILLAFMAGGTIGALFMAMLSVGKYDDIMNNRMDGKDE